MDSQNLSATGGDNQAAPAPTAGQTQTQSNFPPAINPTTKDILEKDIFELMGAKDMPTEQKQKLLNQMNDTIEKRTFAEIYDNLPENDTQEFKQLINNGTPNQVLEFLKSRDINLNIIRLKQALRYKTEMIDLAKPLRRAQNQAKNEQKSK